MVGISCHSMALYTKGEYTTGWTGAGASKSDKKVSLTIRALLLIYVIGTYSLSTSDWCECAIEQHTTQMLRHDRLDRWLLLRALTCEGWGR